MNDEQIFTRQEREKGLLGRGYSMAKALRCNCEILSQCQVIWVKKHWGTGGGWEEKLESKLVSELAIAV